MSRLLILMLIALCLLSACQTMEFRAQGSSQLSVRAGHSLR